MEYKIKKAIQTLSEKSAQTESALEAQQYAQAALNLANAINYTRE